MNLTTDVSPVDELAQKDWKAHLITRDEFADVLRIENETFEFAWTEDDFVRFMAQKYCHGIVAKLDNVVVGYLNYELSPGRIHVHNFAVDVTYRRQKVGLRLASALKERLTRGSRTRIVLEVRETNVVAQMFFRAMQFRLTSTMRDFYDHTQDDAYRMTYWRREGDAEEFKRFAISAML